MQCWFDPITSSFLLYFHVVLLSQALLSDGVLHICLMFAGLARMPVERNTTAEQIGRGVALGLGGVLFNFD